MDPLYVVLNDTPVAVLILFPAAKTVIGSIQIIATVIMNKNFFLLLILSDLLDLIFDSNSAVN